MDNKDVLKKIKNIDGIGIIFVYIAVFTALSIACPNFLKFSNIMVGIRQAVYTAIVGFAKMCIRDRMTSRNIYCHWEIT